MSEFYTQKFVNPSPLYSEIKEDLRSYFEASLIDDMMFPKWTEQCLQRFRMSSHKIEQAVIPIKDYQGCLPDDFILVREAWACKITYSDWIPDTHVRYYQRDCRIADYRESGCSPCFGEDDTCITSCGEGCNTDYMVTHKVQNYMMFTFQRTVLLTPGNINAKGYCGEGCPNMYASTPNSFDIYNGKLITNFAEGSVHLLYYADNINEEGEQLIPDNFYVKEYIKEFIKYKLFCQLSNQTTDESFNQIQLKKNEANQIQAEAYIMADIDLKKKTVFQKVRSIGKSYRGLNKYNIR